MSPVHVVSRDSVVLKLTLGHPLHGRHLSNTEAIVQVRHTKRLFDRFGCDRFLFVKLPNESPTLFVDDSQTKYGTWKTSELPPTMGRRVPQPLLHAENYSVATCHGKTFPTVALPPHEHVVGF